MKRNESIDTVAGIMILYMVFTHVCQHYHFEKSTVYITCEHFLYFFMPWFFFKAGMFFKIGENKVVINKGIRRLLKPFVLYSLLGHICYCVLAFLKNNFHLSMLIPYRSLLLQGSIPGNLPLWFLLSLLGCRIIFNVCKTYGFSSYIIALLSLIIACGLHYVGFEYPYYFSNIMSGLFFLSMGNIIKTIKITPPIYAICIIIYIISFLFPSFVGMRSNYLYYGFYFNWFVYSLCAIILVNQVVKCSIFKRLPFKYVGRYSMEIYCLHWIILIFV